MLVPREARIRRTFVYNLPGVCFKQVMIDSFLLSGSLETENKGGLSSLGTWLCNSQHIGFPLLPSAWISIDSTHLSKHVSTIRFPVLEINDKHVFLHSSIFHFKTFESCINITGSCLTHDLGQKNTDFSEHPLML